VSAGHWLRERLTSAYEVHVRSNEELVSSRSTYQLISVYETDTFGRVLRLDDCNMTSERDEFVYHELMTHPALCAQSSPRRALIIGGGDGGAAKEVLKHACIESVDIAELDPAVVEVSRRWLPAVHQGAFDDARCHVHIGDGFAFLRNSTQHYDLIVMDLTDPDEHAAALYDAPFFALAASKLTATGVLTTHLGARWFHATRVAQLTQRLHATFAHVARFEAFVPLYGAPWCVAASSASTDVSAITQRHIEHVCTARKLAGLKLYGPLQHGKLLLD
jgi:spermidine synthase